MALRRTPLTDRLVTHLKLDNLKLDNLKVNACRVADLKVGGQRLGEFRLSHLGHLGHFDHFGHLGRRGKTLAYGGTALALAGIGGVTAAAAAGPSAPAAFGIASAPRSAGVAAAGLRADSGSSIDHLAASAVAQSGAANASTARPARASTPSGRVQASSEPGSSKAVAAHAESARGSSTQAEHSLSQGPAGGKSPQVVRHASSKSWKQIRDELASQTSPRPQPGKLPMADRLLTRPTSGPQSYLPIGSSQMANATAIVQQTLSKHMGLRAAVIAVATAMQESGLQNLNYGDRDSLGLFQQRPSMGWGTAEQITTPSYAADAFLSALAAHQKADPGWAGEPLWATAQAVQKSGFPTAYAKWEKQAAQLVTSIATKLA